MGDYNGYTNRDTWAMGLNLDNDYETYTHCQGLARHAMIGNEDNPDGFYEELAEYLEGYARRLIAEAPYMLPDFNPASHESPDPRANNGPDDVNGVNWRELAECYEPKDYL